MKVATTALAVLSILLIGSTVTAKNMALETNEVADHFLSTTINFVFDLFLKHYTKKIAEEGKTQIQIGGFDKRFSSKILSLLIEGAFVVDDGSVGNISTLHRTGDAEMNRIGANLTLSAHLGLDDLKIDYNEYDISLLGAHQKGEIHVTVGENSLWLEMKVEIEPKCVISLQDLKIERLGDIKVDITNLGVFENLTDEITSWVTNEVIKSYRNYIERVLFPELSAAVKQADLCHYIPHLTSLQED